MNLEKPGFLPGFFREVQYWGMISKLLANRFMSKSTSNFVSIQQQFLRHELQLKMGGRFCPFPATNPEHPKGTGATTECRTKVQPVVVLQCRGELEWIRLLFRRRICCFRPIARGWGGRLRVSEPPGTKWRRAAAVLLPKTSVIFSSRTIQHCG
ncbi:hypothetical protein [Phyllobacterium salinisoli]|uniref:hypothetical protein n=1 Tax=Phyllobacterium salinisoli TaxID=1899321 RepID=UPI00135A64F8|nr:hypothetical protein [Phyllobacterium salinisoli]